MRNLCHGVCLVPLAKPATSSIRAGRLISRPDESLGSSRASPEVMMAADEDYSMSLWDFVKKSDEQNSTLQDESFPKENDTVNASRMTWRLRELDIQGQPHMLAATKLGALERAVLSTSTSSAQELEASGQTEPLLGVQTQMANKAGVFWSNLSKNGSESGRKSSSWFGIALLAKRVDIRKRKRHYAQIPIGHSRLADNFKAGISRARPNAWFKGMPRP